MNKSNRARHTSPQASQPSARGAGRGPVRGDSATAAESLPPDVPPLRSRPRLMLLFGLVLLAWVCVLLALYFQTVYPFRHPASNAPHSANSANIPASTSSR